MNDKGKVAIIDDEEDMRRSVTQWLQLSGFEPVAFEAAEPALKVLGPDFPNKQGLHRYENPSRARRAPAFPRFHIDWQRLI